MTARHSSAIPTCKQATVGLRLLRSVGCWIACVLLCSCASRERAGAVQPGADAVLGAGRVERSVAPVPAEDVESPPDSVDEWRRAAQRIDALPDAARNAPFMRYARAVAAARMGEREQALELLRGLAGKLPELAGEISELTAECQLQAEPFERLRRAQGLAERGEVEPVTSAVRVRRTAGAARGRQLDRAARRYRQIIRRHPRGSVAERACYSLAQLYFSHGRWEEADRAYTHYLGRYARPGRSRRRRQTEASHYERAIARLAAGHAERALGDLAALRRQGGSGYSSALLRHLEGVALSTSRSPASRALGVRRFREVIRDYPLSFAALASSARLKRLGQPVAHLKPRPAPAVTVSPFELPAEVRLLADLGLYTAAEGALYAAEPALRRQYSPRAGQALCRQYSFLDRGFRRFELARGIVRRNLLRGLPNSDNIWAWECLYPRPYSEATAALEASYELPSSLLHAVMRHESEFRPDAHSPAGAIGLMQLMPATAKRAARELALPYDRDRLERPQYNLQLGAFYLGKLLDSFDQRVALALAGYNAGPHVVSRWLDGIGDLELDLWVARIPYRETRNYVQRVMSSWARYRYLDQGPGAVPDLVLRVSPRRQLTASSY